MKKHFAGFLASIALAMIIVVTFAETSADARMGGGRSFGNRGSRSYAAPAQPMQRQSVAPSTAPQRPVQPQTAQPVPQPAGGGFMRGFGGGLLGGIAGGILGGMLFRGMGWGGEGGGGMGGSGIGIFEIILIAGIGYLIFRMVVNARSVSTAPSYDSASGAQYQATAYQPATDLVGEGVSQIRQMDSGFDEAKFNDAAMDIFFKVQGAWMNKNLSTVDTVITGDFKKNIQGDIDALARDKRTNRLENIAVRKVEMTEAWQEQGSDFVTVLFTANLLDYTTDDTTGAVVTGSKTDPVKFEEYWTFTRSVGANPWKLTAVNQGEN